MMPHDDSGETLPYDAICEMVAGAGYDGMAIDLGAGDVAQAREVRPHMERNGLTPLIVAFPRTIESLRETLIMAKDFGALSQVECWEADVQDGHTTDFRRATKAEDGEKIVFSWVIWPDKATADAAHGKMMEDPRMEEFGDMPFDGKRMIFGNFETLFEA